MTTFQHQARVRKLIYTVLILALFTGSLIHRRFVIESQAQELQLREVDRGEVQLTWSAFRLLLTGSKGLACTILWAQVVEKKERHRFNEVEQLVTSITELMPYFSTPWIYQGHNLAFNISVEYDNARDKYYYVSRGLDRLATGERRNINPGNPEIRNIIGFYYNLKIGTSDERMTMRCLLDLSCLDPLDRDPDKLRADPAHFKKFCEDNPRLVRRLREQLGLTSREQVVDFLDANRDVPNRFKEKKPGSGRSELKVEKEQWPILPPKNQWRRGWPVPEDRDFGISTELPLVDVQILSRTWYLYSLFSVPEAPAVPNYEGYEEKDFNPAVHRIPRRPNIYIFRTFPLRAQENHAEQLQVEGWFDDQGWFIKEWFDAADNPDMGELVGNHPKFDSGRAWDNAARMLEEHAKKTGLYLQAKEKRRLHHVAGKYREKYQLKEGMRKPLPPKDKDPAILESYAAHTRLYWVEFYRRLTNYEGHYYHALAKAAPQGVVAFKLFALAEPLRKSGAHALIFYERNKDTGAYEKKVLPLMAVYDTAVELLLGLMLQTPGARRVLQEDAYEAQIWYIRYVQDQKAEFLKPLTLGMSQWAMYLHPPLDSAYLPYYQDEATDQLIKPLSLGMSRWAMCQGPVVAAGAGLAPLALGMSPWAMYLHPPLESPFGAKVPGLLERKEKNRIIPIRDFRGPFDMVTALNGLLVHDPKDPNKVEKLLVLDDEEEQALKIVLLYWSQGISPTLAVQHPGLQPRQLALITPRSYQARPGWGPLISPSIIASVRSRLRGLQQVQTQQPQQPQQLEQP